MKTLLDAVRPYFIYVPIVSTLSGLFKLFSKDEPNSPSLANRKFSVIDPHEQAKIAVSIIPFIGNFIVGVMDVAEKFFPANQVKVEKELDTEQVAALEKIAQERNEEIEELKLKLNDQQSQMQEVEEQLTSLRKKAASDKNPEIIVSLATQNKDLSEEIKSIQSELEAKDAKLKATVAKLEEEIKVIKRDKGAANPEVSKLVQTIEKLKIDIESKKAIIDLHSSHLKQIEKGNYNQFSAGLVIEKELSTLANFSLENGTPDEYILTSRYQTAKTRVELSKVYLDWRLGSMRTLFPRQLEGLYKAVLDARSAFKSLNEIYPQKDFIKDDSTMQALQQNILDVIEDEKSIALGNDAIQIRLKILDPTYTIGLVHIFIGPDINELDPYRIRVLKLALGNRVRDDIYELKERTITDFAELEPVFEEIEYRNNIFFRLLIPNRLHCLKDLYYLRSLIYTTIQKIESVRVWTEEVNAKQLYLLKHLSEVDMAIDDEMVIIKGGDAIQAHITFLSAGTENEYRIEVLSKAMNNPYTYSKEELLEAYLLIRSKHFEVIKKNKEWRAIHDQIDAELGKLGYEDE